VKCGFSGYGRRDRHQSAYPDIVDQRTRGSRQKNKCLIPHIKVREVSGLIADGTISGGMIPKIQACVDAIASGVGEVLIADGRRGILKNDRDEKLPINSR